ncbi:metalloregulator ArsR/SmtB family transcription factor [Microbacterium sp. SY138]|uniref:ArsR/SmtB family transcription factor n=1 Tax=Microbacterium sp. SY138 TaxID=3149040 RepID=UPI00321A3874
MDSTATPAITPEDADVARAVRVLALLAEPTRFRIILATQYGPMSVNHLADIVERSPAAVSQHLAKLRAAGLVRRESHGNQAFYSAVDEHAIAIAHAVAMQAEHHADGTSSQHHAGENPT